MDALKYFVYIIICLKAETFANERSETYARLLQRIDALEKRDRCVKFFLHTSKAFLLYFEN